MPRSFPALPDAPAATRHPTVATVHGVDLHDDYGWLRADNWQEAMRLPDRLPAALLMAWMPPPDGIAMCHYDEC